MAKPEDFPSAEGKTLAELRAELGSGGPVLAPSVSQLTTGENRFGFGLFDRSRAQIANAPAAVYVAPAGGGEARGPFPARYESLEVSPQYQSRQTSTDPNAAKSIYTAEIPFAKPIAGFSWSRPSCRGCCSDIVGMVLGCRTDSGTASPVSAAAVKGRTWRLAGG